MREGGEGIKTYKTLKGRWETQHTHMYTQPHFSYIKPFLATIIAKKLYVYTSTHTRGIHITSVVGKASRILR